MLYWFTSHFAISPRQERRARRKGNTDSFSVHLLEKYLYLINLFLSHPKACFNTNVNINTIKALKLPTGQQHTSCDAKINIRQKTGRDCPWQVLMPWNSRRHTLISQWLLCVCKPVNLKSSVRECLNNFSNSLLYIIFTLYVNHFTLLRKLSHVGNTSKQFIICIWQ